MLPPRSADVLCSLVVDNAGREVHSVDMLNLIAVTASALALLVLSLIVWAIAETRPFTVEEPAAAAYVPRHGVDETATAILVFDVPPTRQLEASQ